MRKKRSKTPGPRGSGRSSVDLRRLKRIRALLKSILYRISGVLADERMPTQDEWKRICSLAIDIERELDTEKYLVDSGKRPARRGRKPIGPAERHLYAYMVAQQIIERGVSPTTASETVGEQIHHSGRQVRTYWRDSREYILSKYPQLAVLFGK